LKGIFAVTTFWGGIFLFSQNDKDTNLVFFFHFNVFSLIQCHSEREFIIIIIIIVVIIVIIRMMMMKVITAVQRCRWISEGTGLQEKETKFAF
jgi:hypothetical protein